MLSKVRYYLELVSVPIFFFIALHLANTGISSASGSTHSHYKHEYFRIFDFTNFLTMENLLGILTVIFFIWIWHRPPLKKWVPCKHEHCHNEQKVSHIVATIALCLHFFPEAEVRYNLFHDDMDYDHNLYLGILGFGTHFFVDIVVAIIISSYWPQKYQFWLSLFFIAAVWVLTFILAAEHSNKYTKIFSSPIMPLLGSFFIAMFVHRPHKPVTQHG